MEFAVASVVSLGLILFCTAMFYEILAHVWLVLPRLEAHPRLQILLTVFSAFVGHTVAVWAFALTYFVMDNGFAFGGLKGDTTNHILDYAYFSVVSYSSLGLGDVAPTGGLRLLVGVEAIMGLILIGWTVTFTYLVTEKYLAHKRRRHGGNKD